MKTLYTYVPRDIPYTDLKRFVILDVSTNIVQSGADEKVIPIEVWRGDTCHFWDTNKLSRLRREAFNKTREMNGARPRRADYAESLTYAAQMRQHFGGNGG